MSLQAYKTDVTVHSSTLSDLGAGLVTGHIRYEPDGSKYVLVLADGVITNGDCLIREATISVLGVLKVESSNAVTEYTFCVDNRGSATALATGDYFWAKTGGVAYIDPDGTGWADGDPISGGAAGKGDVATLGTHHVFAIAMTDDVTTDTLAGEAANFVFIIGGL